MPRNVRNFWIKAEIDGREKTLGGGPVRKDGGFDLTVYMRREGEVIEPVTIIGRANEDGTLLLRVQIQDSPIHSYDIPIHSVR